MDSGLMQGLAEGLKAGMSSYQEAKKYNEAEEDKKTTARTNKKLYQLQLLKAGVQEDPNNPEGLIPRQDNTAFTNALRNSTLSAYKQAYPNLKDDEYNAAVPPGLMSNQYKELGGSIKPVITLQGQADRAKSYADIGHERNNIARAGLGLRERNSANAINKQFAGDPIVKAVDMQQNSILKGEQQLNSKDKPITNQMLNEIQNDYANAITGGRQAAQGTIHDQQMQTAQARLANLKQYVTGAPEQAATPEQIKYFKTAFNELKGLNQQIRKSRIDTLSEGSDAAYGNEGPFGRVIGTQRKNANGQGLIAAPAPQSGPKIGDVEDGHVFLGGNPADPKSWRAQ